MELADNSYSFRIICFSAFTTLFSYFLGSLIFFAIHSILGILYLTICFISLLIAFIFRCRFCVYYGYWCCSGFGKITSLLFSKGDPKEFQNPRNFLLTAIFSFGVLLAPIVGAFFLILIEFNLINILILVIYLVLGVAPGFLMRQKICELCKQKDISCPAYEQMMGIRKEEKINQK